MECGEEKQKEGEEIVFVDAAVVQKQESDIEMNSVSVGVLCHPPSRSSPGEEKQKEGEEIVFVDIAVVQKQESDREMNSVSVGVLCHSPSRSSPFPTLLNNNPIVVHRTPTVGAVVWLRQDRWWRCL